ncbi:MFS transporter [Streptomyces kanamyceticus]|uniref:MFS transporter n=1 Tax=Streptomyces kanamyceticus TaxID=1967 RepID=A0A5J6GK96_STRKN|nr:MFS transporter [Streptomyces kanamyceticus]QEU95587.1 MFS transporter [Streptomyces kanamyceticus]
MTAAPALRRHLTLACSVVGAMIVALDGTVLTVVQPVLQRDLDASFAQVQWTSTGYLIAVASLLVFAGRLGDRYGHRRLFAVGTLGFALASAGIGLASGIGWVIALRVVQGVCGALLQPATLGMLRAAFPPDKLAMPIALRTSAIGLAAATGPLLGGALATHLGWRSVFFLNVVPALAIGVLALLVRVPAPRRRGPAPRLDVPGAVLLAVTLAALVHTLVAVAESGPTAGTWAGLLVTAVAGGAFARHERRTPGPLVPPGLLASAAVGPALCVLLAASAAMFGALFVATYFLQDVLALDPLRSAVQALPLAVLMVVAAPLAAVILRAHGPRRTVMTAMAVLTAGVLVLSRLGPDPAAGAVGAGFLLVGAGFGTVMVAATTVAVRHAPVGDAGVAGGLQQTAMNIGPALGVALATALMTLLTPATTRPGATAPHWSDGDFVAAMGPTLTVLAVVAALGALVAARLPRRNAETAAAAGTDATDTPPPVSAAPPPPSAGSAPPAHPTPGRRVVR